MMDNLTIQEFNSLFTYTMYDVMQGLYDFPPTSLYLILGISFVLHIFSLKTWFDNRAKNEALLEMIQSLQTDNDQLKGQIRIQPIWWTKPSQWQKGLRHWENLYCWKY